MWNNYYYEIIEDNYININSKFKNSDQIKYYTLISRIYHIKTNQDKISSILKIIFLCQSLQDWLGADIAVKSSSCTHSERYRPLIRSFQEHTQHSNTPAARFQNVTGSCTFLPRTYPEIQHSSCFLSEPYCLLYVPSKDATEKATRTRTQISHWKWAHA